MNPKGPAKIDISELQKLFSVVASPLLLVDLSTQHILFLNHPAEELTGYVLTENNQDLLFLGLFPGQHNNVITAILDLAHRAQGTNFSARENDIELRRKSGRACPINISAALMQHHNRNLLVITLEDLTEVKRNEKEHQELLKRAAHDAKLVDIGRLAAGMAHELNNPLAILDGFSESLEDLIMADDFNAQLMRKNILPIRKSTQRMSQIVSKMMGKIRGQNTSQEIKSLKQVVNEALIILEHVTKAQSIHLSVDVQDLFINCDATQIEQIITNIVMNAFNALESRKEGREIRITSHEKVNTHQLEIWNNGDPIPAEIQTKIFTPFFTTKQPGEGTGLGLYMSFNIMKSHSGELNFKSDQKSGTSFYLNFPKASNKTTEKPQVHPNKVLVVDEDLFFRKHLIKKLKHFEFEGIEAGTTAEAWDRLQSLQDSVDLILINDQLKSSSEIDLINLIQVHHPSLRIVFLFNEPTDIRNQCAFLTKPVRELDLANLFKDSSGKN